MKPALRSAMAAAALLVSLATPWIAAAPRQKSDALDLEDFFDSAHHWYDINEGEKVVLPEPGQKKYASTQVAQIADNILLYQKSNGGWPKNYDMQAILSEPQLAALRTSKQDTMSTTIDNGATHAQTEYLAKAFLQIGDARYKEACERGIDYLLAAQYQNGGWSQFYPDRSGYRKYITFNDGAMTGVMRVFQRVMAQKKQYAFLDEARRQKIADAYGRGIDAILKCQIRVDGKRTVWCQQHDHVTYRPQNARMFEPASFCSMESADIVRFLMDIPKPSPAVIEAVNGAVAWFRATVIRGIKVETVKAPKESWEYHSADFDRRVVQDAAAPPIWARMYELGTMRPMFCNRDGKPVYTLAEVSRERRTGYGWYNNDPQRILDRHSAWLQHVGAN